MSAILEVPQLGGPPVGKKSQLRVLVFCWNTKSVRLAGADNTAYWTLTSSHDPDFFPAFAVLLEQQQPDIVVVGFQEDAYPGSHFHSRFLPEKMPPLGYFLVRRSKMIGVGMTTYKAIQNLDVRARGLRISLYVRGAIFQDMVEGDRLLEKELGYLSKEYVCTPAVLRNKGATALYTQLPIAVGDTGGEDPTRSRTSAVRLVRLAFVNCHLPFNSDGLTESHVRQNPLIRQNDLFIQNYYFNRIHESLILDSPVPIDFAFYFGDFNYRLKGVGDAVEIANRFEQLYRQNSDASVNAAAPVADVSSEYSKIYRAHDELHDQMSKQLLYCYQEGLDNSGPLFLPTCKLHKNRYGPFGIFRTGCHGQRAPSWTDRILFLASEERNRSPDVLRCLHYNRFDEGNTMKMSDHGAVVGVYQLNGQNLAPARIDPAASPVGLVDPSDLSVETGAAPYLKRVIPEPSPAERAESKFTRENGTPHAPLSCSPVTGKIFEQADYSKALEAIRDLDRTVEFDSELARFPLSLARLPVLPPLSPASLRSPASPPPFIPTAGDASSSDDVDKP